MDRFFSFFFFLLIGFSSCQGGLPEASSVDSFPDIFPDYTEVTIPVNIAPLNFKVKEVSPAIALFSIHGKTFRIDASKGVFDIPVGKWKELLHRAVGDSIQVRVYVEASGQWHQYKPFSIYVVPESIDSWLVYRRIAPGYRMWSEMGIYQRCLEDFTEKAILQNKLTDNSCMNCHSFCMQDPGRMLFHQRSSFGGTYLIQQGKIGKLFPKMKDGGNVPTLVYPYWHPSGNYVAFSTNETHQDFHLSDPNRIEVFDKTSDIWIYDVGKQELFSTPSLRSVENLETFPAFSPDGKRLFFCSATSVSMPEHYRDMKYNLVSLSFDAESRSFGTTVDTLYNARMEGRSAKFPRVSPDGKYLMYTLSDYGNFSIWHKDADLRLINLQTLETDSLSGVNSNDVESYHSWSSNSRWFVFSSRRIDGLYTRPYLCYIDKNGQVSKPFLLPQRDPDYYLCSLFSFNIPEFVKDKIETSSYDLVKYMRKSSSEKKETPTLH